MREAERAVGLTSPVTRNLPSGEKAKAVMAFLPQTQTFQDGNHDNASFFRAHLPGGVDDVALSVVPGVQQDHHTPARRKPGSNLTRVTPSHLWILRMHPLQLSS